MKKLFLLLLVFSSIASSAVNECETDVYFGNGILTKQHEALRNAGILRKAIKQRLGIDYYNKNIGKVDYAYNRTDGEAIDLLESLLQKMDGTLVQYIARYVKLATTLAGLLTQEAHDADLSLQITHYEESIKNGHKVLVVAHSQGNFFAYEAYNKLPEWMKNYWEAISIATPMNCDIKQGTPRINWDNDLVSYLAFGNTGWVDNPVRKIGWNALRSEIGLSNREKRPDDSYTFQSQVGGESPKGDWVSNEDYLSYQSGAGLLGGLDDKVHAFSFYMGEYLGGKKNPILNQFDGKAMQTDKARTKIMAEIETKLKNVLPFKSSQWKPKNLGCLCKDKYAKMTHKFDPALMDIHLEDEKVKDFAEGAKGKIYSVTYKGERQYVRAACGGEIIKEVDEGEVCYVLEDNNESKFGEIEGDREQDTSLPGGLFTASLTWSETIVSMKMANGLMGKSVEGCGFAKLSSGDLELSSVYPGTYPISVAAEGYEDLEDEGLSDIVTLSVKAVKAKKTDKFNITKKYEYPNLGKGGHIADIVITQPEPGEPAQTEVVPTTIPSS